MVRGQAARRRHGSLLLQWMRQWTGFQSAAVNSLDELRDGGCHLLQHWRRGAPVACYEVLVHILCTRHTEVNILVYSSR
jgi:hypothetical protein